MFNVNENDLELKLLAGSPITVDDVGKLHPLQLEEIMEIGEQQYNKHLFAATFKQDDLVLDGHTLTPFESVVVYVYQDENFREMYLSTMSILLKEELHFHKNGFFYLGELEDRRFLTQENYEEIVSIIKKQNFIKEQSDKEEEFKPHDDKARELIEKLKQFRQRVKEQNRDNGLNLSDIISIVAAYSENINIFNVWKMTVYQLYSMYIRLMMKDSYESQLYLLPHSSDPKSSDLKHWASKIEI